MLPGMPSLADRLVPDELWELVEPLLPPRPPREHRGRPRQVPDRACFAAVVFMLRASTPWELRGSCCPPESWAAGAGPPPTGASRTGRGPGCSTSCTWSCSTGSARPAGWTGAGSAWTPSASAPPKRGPHRPKPHRPRQARQQAPPRRRRHGHPTRAAADRRQPQRLDDVRAAAGRPPGRAHPDRTAALPARQGPRRQGLRPPPLPRLPAPTPDQSTDRPAWDRVLRAARPPPVEGRAHRRVAAGLPAPPGPLRPLRRALLRLRPARERAGLLPDLDHPAMVRIEMSS